MAKAKGKRRKYISYILRFAVAGGALYLAFRGEDLGKIAEVLGGLNLWVFAAALGLYVTGQLIFVARWSLLLRVQSIRIGFWPAVRLHFLGLFYNNCLPGAIGGDLPRAWYVTRHTDKKLEAILSVFVDRVVGLAGMLIMAFFCYWFIPGNGGAERFEFSFEINFLQRLSEYRWIVGGIGAAFAAVAVVLISNAKGRSVLGRGIGLIREHGRAAVRKAYKAVGIYWSKKSALVLALVLTFCCQSMHVTAMWLIGREIGLGAGIKYYFIFFPISWLLGTVPISIGGLGIMEGWLKVMFSRVSAGSGELSLVLALCQRLVMLFASLPGAVIHLIGAHLPKDFFIDYEDGIN